MALRRVGYSETTVGFWSLILSALFHQSENSGYRKQRWAEVSNSSAGVHSWLFHAALHRSHRDASFIRLHCRDLGLLSKKSSPVRRPTSYVNNEEWLNRQNY